MSIHDGLEQNEPPRKPKRKKKKMSRLFRVLIILIVLILVIIAAVPFVISSSAGTNTILSKVNNAIDGELNLADLSMSWFKGIRAKQLQYSDSAGTIKVNVDSVDVKPHYLSMLRGNFSFGKTIIDSPKIAVRLAQQNDTIDAKRETSKPSRTKPKPGIPVQQIDLQINNGVFEVTDADNQGVEIRKINSRLNLRPANEKTEFEVQAAVNSNIVNVNGSGELKSEDKQWNLGNTTGTLTVEIDDFKMDSLKPILALAGIKAQTGGTFTGKINANIEKGALQNLDADIDGQNIVFGGEMLGGDTFESKNVTVTSEMRSQGDVLLIDTCRAKADWVQLEATGSFPMSKDSWGTLLSPNSQANLQGNFNVDLAAASKQIPGVLKLKKGTTLTSGVLEGTIKTTQIYNRKGVQAVAALSDVKGFVEEKPVVISQPMRTNIEMISDGKTVTFKTLELYSTFVTLSGKGTLDQFDFKLKSDLAEMKKEIGQLFALPDELNGLLETDGRIEIDDEQIRIRNMVSVKNFRMGLEDGKRISEPQVKLTFNGSKSKTDKKLLIDSLAASTQWGQMALTDAVVPLGEEKKKGIRLPMELQVDLSGARPYLVMFGNFSSEIGIGGTLTSKFNFQQLNNGRLSIFTDQSSIRNLTIHKAGEEPYRNKLVTMNLDVEIDPKTGSKNVKSCNIDTEGLKVNFVAKLDNAGDETQLEGTADLDYDWAVVSSIAAPVLPKGTKLTGKRTDKIEFSSTYPKDSGKMLANMNSKGTLGFETAQAEGLDIGKTEVPFEFADGLLTIAPFASQVNKGTMNFAAKVDFTKEPAILEVPGSIQIFDKIHINQNMEKQLTIFGPLFVGAKKVSGIVNFKTDRMIIPLSGKYKHMIDIVGNYSMYNLEIEGSGLMSLLTKIMKKEVRDGMTIHPTDFTVKDNFMKYTDRMRLEAKGNFLEFKGRSSIDPDGPLEMDVQVPISISGNITRVKVPLRGTPKNIDDPDLGNLLQENLLNIGLDLLRKSQD